uniref:Tick transposon n=1 Tax=Rhipicephalus zambeziensis TaxID=60191 RepID=A0A224Z3B7_9ACAR
MNPDDAKHRIIGFSPRESSVLQCIRTGHHVCTEQGIERTFCVRLLHGEYPEVYLEEAPPFLEFTTAEAAFPGSNRFCLDQTCSINGQLRAGSQPSEHERNRRPFLRCRTWTAGPVPWPCVVWTHSCNVMAVRWPRARKGYKVTHTIKFFLPYPDICGWAHASLRHILWQCAVIGKENAISPDEAAERWRAALRSSNLQDQVWAIQQARVRRREDNVSGPPWGWPRPRPQICRS